MYTDGTLALRISDPHPEKAAPLHIDALIRAELLRAGIPTPQTRELGHLPDGRAYSLETLIRGDDSAPSALGWQELGQALAVLHALPHQGYGLLQNRDDRVVGRCAGAEQGFQSRLEHAWPFDGRPLSAKALVWLAPELTDPLTRLEEELRALAKLPTAVCHTDLHRAQCIWRGGRLAALLDFGDASIGPAAWDWASLAYFHGWAVAGQVSGQPLGRQVPLFGLLLAFHRASRAVVLNRPERGQEAVAFARSCLERL